MFAINSIIWLGIIIVTIVVDNIDDFSEVVENADISDLLEDWIKDSPFDDSLYNCAFLCVLYQAYAKSYLIRLK